MILKEQNDKLVVQNFPRMFAYLVVSHMISKSIRYKLQNDLHDNECYAILRSIINNIESFEKLKIQNATELIAEYKLKY